MMCEFDLADIRTVAPAYRGDMLAGAMRRTLDMHRTAGAWNGEHWSALCILSDAGFTAAEVIEYAPDVINKGLTNEHDDQRERTADRHRQA